MTGAISVQVTLVPLADGTEITLEVPGDALPTSLRFVRGGRLVHEFTEPEAPAQPALLQREAEQ